MSSFDHSETAGPQSAVTAHFCKDAPYWTEIYERGGLHEAIHQERLRAALAMVDSLGLPPAARALDVGCGAGFATVGLARRGFVVEALDPVQVMVDATRNRAIEAGLDSLVTARIGDVHALPFPDGTRDLVLALGVLPWLPQVDEPLREMSRVLRVDGHLIVSVDNLWQLCHLFDPIQTPLLRWPRQWIGDRLRSWGWLPASLRSQPTSLRKLTRALAAEGFEELHRAALGFGPFTFLNREILPRSLGLRLNRRLQSMAYRGAPTLRSGGSQYLVLAKKRGVGSTDRQRLGSTNSTTCS